MGIYDREYYRDETSGSGWLTGVAPVTRAIIVINVLVFLYQIFTHDPFVTRSLAVHSTDIFEKGYVWQPLTSAFLHSGGWHIFVNMFVLWWVGRELEALYGSREYLLLYGTAAVFSMFTWAAIDYFVLGQGSTALGASGAVTALFVIYAMYNPRRIILINFIIPTPLWLAAILYIVLDSFTLMSQIEGGSAAHVAVAAHLGGAAYGFLYKRFDLRWSRLLSRRAFPPRLRIVGADHREPASRPRRPSRTVPPSSTVPPTHRAAPPAHVPSEQLDERLDEVLAKIAREGRTSLTEEENQVLQEASRRARDRRSERIR